MPAKTRNGVDIPVGSDPYALTADLKRAFESATLTIPVATLAERNALAAKFPNDALPVGLSVARQDLPGVTESWDGTRWVKLGGVQRAEFVGSIGVLVNENWGPGPLTFDNPQSRNSAGFSSPERDLVTLPGPGEYAIAGRFRMSANNTGVAFASLMNEAASTEYTSADIPVGYSTAHLVYPNFYTPTAMTLRFRFRTSTPGTPTLTSRIAISRIG